MDMPLTTRRMQHKVFPLLDLEGKMTALTPPFLSTATGQQQFSTVGCTWPLERKRLPIIPHAHSSDLSASLPWMPFSHRLGKQGYTFGVFPTI